MAQYVVIQEYYINYENMCFEIKLLCIIPLSLMYRTLSIPSPFQNLVDITLQKIFPICFPKEFGTLPSLEVLDVSHNHLGRSIEYAKWEWLQQTAVKNNLKDLHLHNNEVSCTINLPKREND